jgi:hypothetical protein
MGLGKVLTLEGLIIASLEGVTVRGGFIKELGLVLPRAVGLWQGFHDLAQSCSVRPTPYPFEFVQSPFRRSSWQE